MSKFIEVTTGEKMLVNTSEIVSVEPSQNLKGDKGCMITFIHTTKCCVEGRKLIVDESYEEVKQMIMEG